MFNEWIHPVLWQLKTNLAAISGSINSSTYVWISCCLGGHARLCTLYAWPNLKYVRAINVHAQPDSVHYIIPIICFELIYVGRVAWIYSVVAHFLAIFVRPKQRTVINTSYKRTRRLRRTRLTISSQLPIEGILNKMHAPLARAHSHTHIRSHVPANITRHATSQTCDG